VGQHIALLGNLLDACCKLNDSKDNGENENRERDPKYPPLNYLPSVSPDLKGISRLVIIKRVFQILEASSPISIVFN